MRSSASAVEGAAAEEDLADRRERRAREVAEVVGRHRHVAPAEERETRGLRVALDQLAAAGGVPRRRGEKDHADAVRAGGGEGDPEPAGLGAQEAVGDLQQQAGAVAGGLVAADRAAVLEVHEHAHPVLDHLVERDAVEPRDEADAAVAPRRLSVDQAASALSGIPMSIVIPVLQLDW